MGMDCTSHALQVATSATAGEEEEQQEAAAAAGGGTHGGGGLAGYSAAPSVEASTGERAVSVTPPLGKKRKIWRRIELILAANRPTRRRISRENHNDLHGKPGDKNEMNRS